MVRCALAFILLVLFSSLVAFRNVSQSLPYSKPGNSFISYLPLVQKPPQPPKPPEVQIIETARAEIIKSYPSHYYIYGYVSNLTSDPLTVTVDLDVTIFPAQPFRDSPTDIVHLTPALTVTLPGQPNPSAYDLYFGKATASLGPILGASTKHWQGGNTFYPLTIISWAYQGTSVSGIVQNDNHQALDRLRVVVAQLDKCPWKQAMLDALTLKPGEETGFHLDYLTTYCLVDNPMIVGQGIVQR